MLVQACGNGHTPAHTRFYSLRNLEEGVRPVSGLSPALHICFPLLLYPFHLSLPPPGFTIISLLPHPPCLPFLSSPSAPLGFHISCLPLIFLAFFPRSSRLLHLSSPPSSFLCLPHSFSHCLFFSKLLSSSMPLFFFYTFNSCCFFYSLLPLLCDSKLCTNSMYISLFSSTR